MTDKLTDAMICGDCGWKGSTAAWKEGCKGSPCELNRPSDDKLSGLVERLLTLAKYLVGNSGAATVKEAAAELEALQQQLRVMREALETALINVECVEGDKCPHWVEWHHVARKALSTPEGSDR